MNHTCAIVYHISPIPAFWTFLFTSFPQKSRPWHQVPSVGEELLIKGFINNHTPLLWWFGYVFWGLGVVSLTGKTWWLDWTFFVRWKVIQNMHNSGKTKQRAFLGFRAKSIRTGQVSKINDCKILFTQCPKNLKGQQSRNKRGLWCNYCRSNPLIRGWVRYHTSVSPCDNNVLCDL